MVIDLLAYLAENNGAPVTQVKKDFDLSSAMAANLLIQLVDAGHVVEHELKACHHLEGTTSACASKDPQQPCSTSCSPEHAFEQGCCGMNGPYRITAEGRVFLARMRAMSL